MTEIWKDIEGYKEIAREFGIDKHYVYILKSGRFKRIEEFE